MATQIKERPKRSRADRGAVRRQTAAKAALAQTEDQLDASFLPDALRLRNLDWAVLVWMLPMHLGCLAAPFFFSWSGLVIAVLMHFLTACVGVTLCYHRYLAHRGFKLRSPARFFVYLCGSLSVEGSPLTWAANHRLHHAKSDQPGDPHSPLDGKWWSHLLWMFIYRGPKLTDYQFKKYVPDLMQDRLLVFFEKTWILWSFALGALLYWGGGVSWLLWGMCIRLVVVYHCTWFVNSATHLWGYRTYETKDMSKNLWWVALLTYGEGWHNNHHAYPALARSGHRWWEIDVTFWVIRLLQWTGQAYDVKDAIPNRAHASPI